MSSWPNESKPLCAYLGMEESVDYGSDTSLEGDARTMSDTPMSEVHPPTTLSPFAERDDIIVTNPLDEQQALAVQREESARRHAQMVMTLRNQRDYVFTPPSVEERLCQTTGQSLATWTIGPVAASAEEGASGQALCETKDEEDNDFIRWVERTRRLSIIGQLRNRTRYASATTVVASAGQTGTTNPPTDTTSGGKRPRSRNDTGHDVQKHPRRMGNVAEGVSHTPMSSPTLVLVAVGVPKEEHEKVLLEMSGLRETLGKTQSALDATQARVQVLESGHTRMEAQPDLLIRMQQPMARPTSAAQAPPSSCGTDPDTA
uniref:Uncharacterized protein n=1 Tax=Hyaloperonospora arabidopsidis (strain Emoy2) TaxID=559515 RepID=M4B7H5_HYAAE